MGFNGIHALGYYRDNWIWKKHNEEGLGAIGVSCIGTDSKSSKK